LRGACAPHRSSGTTQSEANPNLVYRNNITECNESVHLTDSTHYNRIWLNNFERAWARYAYSWGSLNNWSWQGEGNYWGNYSAHYDNLLAGREGVPAPRLRRGR
jgi:nitrous oxidase accessory protein NosD